MKTRPELAALFSLILLLLPTAPPADGTKLPGVPLAAREALLRGETDPALAALDKAAIDDPKSADAMLYLRAVCLAQAERRAQALEALDQLARTAPKSPWIHKSAFLRADLLRLDRRFEEAASIYEAQALRLSGPERQGELAQIYLRFAEELAAPPNSPSGKPDYLRAADLFARVLELAAPDSLRERAAYRRAQCFEAAQDWTQSLSAHVGYLTAFDPAGTARAASGSPLWIFTARLTLSRAQLKLGDHAGARRTLEDLSAELRLAGAGEGKLGGALRALSAEKLREVLNLDGEAQYAMAGAWFGSAGNRSLGVAALARFVERFPTHARTPRARLELGEGLVAEGRAEDARAVFDAILALPAPKDAEAAKEAAQIAARALYVKGLTFTSDDRHEEARAAFVAYTLGHPSGSDWGEAQQRILQSEYSVGKTLRDREEYDAAKQSWTEYLTRHPLDPEAAKILYDIGELDASVAAKETTPEPERPARWRAAIAAWRELEAKYADKQQDWVGRARMRIGFVLETEFNDFDGAIAAYKSCESTPSAGSARAALLAMTEPALSLSVESAVLGSEAVRARLDLRNVEKLTVEVWRLDLEAYYRKNLTHANVESLDLDLITAQQKFELPVAEYARYKSIEQAFDIDVKGPGAWVIAVSSEKLRASALCLRTDLDMIVKSTPDETLVFVQNMARSEPASGVRVLAALGERRGSASPVVLEGTTDARGFVRFALEPRSSQGHVSVLAMGDGHWASSGVDFPVQSVPTLSPRATLYTERPAYRPGETVHWRAIVRGAKDGQFIVEPGRKLDWRINDSRGRLVASETLALSEYGTLGGDFELPAASSLGGWSMTLALDETTTVNAGFTVAQFQLVHVSLDVAFERSVYYRGEDAVALIDARYSHGGPVADAPLAFRLPDGRVSEGRTDAQGRARVSFPTRELAQEQMLELSATLSDEPLTNTARAWLALREYSLELRTARDTYGIDSPLTVRVRAHGPDLAGLAKTAKLAAQRITMRPGIGRTFTAVSEVDVSTNAAGDGTGVLKLAKSGRYVLRLSATDRFGNPIEAQKEVEIVGDDDELSLRMLADADTLKVGGTGSVAVLERKQGGLALLTFEVGRVVDWRWMKLTPGSNTIDFPVADVLSPGFVLSVAHQRRGEFRRTQLEFTVERELTVKLTPRGETLAPGTESAIDIEVRDAFGKPVAAELSLAIVDDALFELYPESLPDLRALFQPPPRAQQSAVGTDSSSTFKYRGASWEVSSEVLAEVRRELEDRKWDASREELAVELNSLGRIAGRPVLSPGTSTIAEADEPSVTDGIGGQYGGRRGGSKSKRAFGGGGADKDSAGGPDPLSLRSPTAFWSAAIVTDAQGKASAKFSAPDTSARWRVSARAAAKDPRAASATTYFTTRAAFFIELRTPQALMEGDKPRFFARLHNTTSAPIAAELKWLVRGGGVEATLPAGKVTVPPGAMEVAMPELTDAIGPGTLSLSLVASAEISGARKELRDTTALEVAGWGTEFSDAKSGELTSDMRLDLALATGRKYTNLSLELFVGPSLDAILIDAALGQGRVPLFRGLPDDSASIAADLYGAAEVLAQLARSGRSSSPDFARVRERVQSLTAAVVAAQDPEQGWNGAWNNSEVHTDLTVWCMLALANARDGGISVAQECSETGIAALDQLLRSTPSDERKALIQHALSRWGRGDYGALNRLHRMRNELSNAALAHTALALIAMERGPMAAEIAGVIESRGVFDAARPELGCFWNTEKNLPWSRSKVGTAAFCVLALQGATPKSEQLKSGVQYLVAHRPWSDPRSIGVALAALARHAGTTVPSTERLEITASIAGGAPQVLELSKGGSLIVSLEASNGGSVRVDLALKGRGTPHYSAILRGFSSENGELAAQPFTVNERAVLAPAPLWRGKPVSVGFGVVRHRREQWFNRVQNLVRGTNALSFVSFRRDSARRETNDGDWLVMEIPIPAGTHVRPGSVNGSISGSRILPDRILAYIPPDSGWANVGFEIEGAIPGKYRVGPAVLRSVSDPSLISIGKASEFTVLPSGGKLPDEYRATPDEMYGLGMAAWNAGDSERARESLSQLMAGFESELNDENSQAPLQQAAGALFFMALDRSDAREVVRWFEVLREKRRDLVIPFDKILAVAKSYSTIDEHERALSILRASIEQTFGVDLKVAGALETQGDASQALTLLANLWREYPDAPAVLETWLALSDKLLTKAPKAAEDKSLVRDARTRASLHLEGTRLLQWFLCLYPRDPQAPEAALNLIAAHLGLEDYTTASTLAQNFAARFTSPEFADAFLYSRAVAEWYLGNDEEALRVCERVATSVYKDARGIERPSKNRELAQYILAQIHHARREVERAAEYYAKVELSFADAKAALGELRARTLSMDEVTRVKPGETARLALRSKNVAEVELAVYPVDLMTLYLREGSLSKVAQVDLSGIAPELARTMKLDGAKGLRENEQKLELALPKTGAYLVIARGGELFASGLILVTELELDVTEDAERGGVRVQVVDGRSGSYVRDVDVRVVGSANKKIQRMKSDLRGMVSLDQVLGQATIIARASGDRYAFYRGTTVLGDVQPSGGIRKQQEKAVEQLSQEAYLSNVIDFNRANQSQRADKLVEEIGRQRLGVQIDQVK